MKRLLLIIFVLAVLFSSQMIQTVYAQEKENSIVIFFTGNELGQLKPCGCSGGQLGGLERRKAIFDTVPDEQRLIVDTGSLIAHFEQQDLIKFNIIVQALAMLKYDVVNLELPDVETAEKLGLLEPMNGMYNVLNAYRPEAKTKFTKIFFLNQKEMTISLGTFDANSSNVEGVHEIFADRSQELQINILILNYCDEKTLSAIAASQIVDVVICPTKSDKPMIMGDAGAKPLVFSVGQFGRYIAKLTFSFDTADKLKVDFSDIAVAEKLPQQKELIALNQSYQAMVKQANLLENSRKYGLSNGLEYIGTNACSVCHDHADEHGIWLKNKHSHAFETLEKAGYQFDPECVTCHVVGFEYKTGYINQVETDYLKDVGCEICHGPGSEHLRTLGKSKMPEKEPKTACLRCHTPEHSGEFAGKKAEYFEKIKHWREPKIADEVQIDKQKK